jgi:hypothetical protein
MDKIINVLLLIIIFVFDPLAIALVVAANFAFAQLRSKEGYDMYKDKEDNEGSDVYTEEDLSVWDSTLMDGLEEEEFEDEDLTEPEIEVKMSGEPSLDMLSEDQPKPEEKLLNNPGISSWRKKKIRDYLDGKTKTYW